MHTIWGCSIAHEKHEGEKKAKRKKEDKDEDEDGRQKMEGRLNTEGMGLSQSFKKLEFDKNLHDES